MKYRIGLRAALAGAAMLLMAGAQPSWAQTAKEQVDVARAVVQKSGVMSSMDDAVAIFLDEGKRTFQLRNPDLQDDLDSSVKVLLPAFQQRHEQLVSTVAGLYAQRFSLQELKDISAFYDTPSGRKLAQTLPSVQRDVYEAVNLWSQRMSQEVVTAIRSEMKKRGHDL